MSVFKSFEKLDYKDIIELDGAFSAAHINYGKAPTFNKTDGRELATKSRKNSLSDKKRIENVLDYIYSFDGTEKDFKSDDCVLLWKSYWLEYVNAFDKLIETLPNSVVTIYVGRQAVEIGFKYLLLKQAGQIIKDHDLGKLTDLLYSKYNINQDYMEYVDTFCKVFCQYIEGGNVEYFRFPEYKENAYFAGNRLDIKWLSCNLALIILKLIHFAGLDAGI